MKATNNYQGENKQTVQAAPCKLGELPQILLWEGCVSSLESHFGLARNHFYNAP
jgi:hypothetical protein